jgi:uncharacterized protein DUF748
MRRGYTMCTPMRRGYLVLSATAVLVAVVLAAIFFVLPPVARWAVVKGVKSATDRNVAVSRLELNLFTGRLALVGLRLDDRHGGPPLAELARVDARFRVLPLVIGRLHLDELIVQAPRINVSRSPTGELSVADLIERYGTGESKSSQPVDVVLGRMRLDDGRLTFADARVAPARTWDVAGLAAEVRDVATRNAGARGTASIRLTFDGAPVTVDAEGITLDPPAARVSATITDLDLAGFWAYVEGTPPLLPRGGRASMHAAAEYSTAGGVRGGGDVTIKGLELLRDGQSEPLVSSPVLELTSRDVVYKDGQLSAAHLEIRGDPSIVDGTVTPARRYDLRSVVVSLDDASHPTMTPARLLVTAALPSNGTVRVSGNVELEPIAADVKVNLAHVDLRLARPYIPASVPVSIADGRLAVALSVLYGRDGAVVANGDVELTALSVVRRGERAPFLSLPALKTTMVDARLQGETVRVARVTVTGAPTMSDHSVSPPRELTLRSLAVHAADVTWPATGDTKLRVNAELPESGALLVDGTAALATRTITASVTLKDAALTPYHAWLPISAPIAGRVSSALNVGARLGDAPTVTAQGTATASGIVFGSGQDQPLSVEKIALSGIDVRWPSQATIARVTVTQPSVLVVRDKDGSFPLRAMLTPPAASPAPATATSESVPSPAALPASATATSESVPAPPPAARMALEIGEVVINEGSARFVDRSTTPFYSEEFSRLAVTVRHIRSGSDARADVALQGVVGVSGALQLAGQVAPLADVFYLDLAGELTNIPLARTNPYVRYYSGWMARTGSLTTKLHYRIVGDQLDASNDIEVQQLNVVRAPADAGDAKRVGLPLGMIVAIATDSRGDIKFSVPVSGKLSAPDFSLGGAIWAAVRNVLVNIAAAPFRALGKLFSGGGGGGSDAEPQLKIDPVTFEPGSAALTPEAQSQLQRVAEFLRASPQVRLTMGSLVTEEDVASLKTQEVVARIQRVQREQRLAEFSAAAAAVFAQARPKVPVPKSPDDIVAALREEEPAPQSAVEQLRTRRLEITREALVQGSGIEPARVELVADAAKATAEREGGRVEFNLKD